MKPTQKQFNEYQRILATKKFSPYDAGGIQGVSRTGLTVPICAYIRLHHEELVKEYANGYEQG